MDLKEIFNQDFVASVKKVLTDKCKDGGALKRSELLALVNQELKLDLDANASSLVQESILKSAIDLGVFDSESAQYGNFKGRYGGVAEVDLEVTQKLQTTYQKRVENMAKARAARSAKAQQRHQEVAQAEARQEELRRIRQANAAKAREARAAKRAAQQNQAS